MSKYINEDQQLSQSHSQPQPPQQPPELGSLQTSMMEPLRILEPAESRIMVSLEAIELTSNFDDVSEHSVRPKPLIWLRSNTETAIQIARYFWLIP